MLIMETHREPGATDYMLNKVDTEVTSSYPTVNHTFTDGNSGSRHCCKKPFILLFVIIGVVLVGLVIMMLEVAKRRDTNTSQTKSEQLEGLLKPECENTAEEEKTTDVHNISAELFTCVYNTSKAVLEKLSKDPFGDKCILSSHYVSCKCNRNDGHSTQNCINCEGSSGPEIPEFCFCDEITHCGNYDAFGKKECNYCLDYFQRSPFKERGNCSCSQTPFMISESCSCHEGFSNLMCSSIEKRICKSRFEKKKTFSSCIESNDETCVLKGCDGDEFICEIFNEGNKDLRKNADTCQIVNLNNTECVETESTTTEQGRDNKLAPTDSIYGNNSDTCEQIFANVLIYAFMCTMLALNLTLF